MLKGLFRLWKRSFRWGMKVKPKNELGSDWANPIKNAPEAAREKRARKISDDM
jgi:hypothetical protein